MTDFRLGRSQVIPPVIKNLIIINVIVFLIQIDHGAHGFRLDGRFFRPA